MEKLGAHKSIRQKVVAKGQNARQYIIAVSGR
jgi:hypothetical protein